MGVERAGSPDPACAVDSPHSPSVAGSGFPLVQRFCDHRGFAFPAARSEMAPSRLGSEFSAQVLIADALPPFGAANVSVGSIASF